MTQAYFETTPSVLSRARGWITGPLTPRLLALLAFGLGMPALALGLTTDDRALLDHVRQGSITPLTLFNFVSKQSDVVSRMQTGELPWWVSLQSRVSFLRPLSSLWHYVEFAYWPHATWLMALENIALYAVTVWIAARIYRWLLPSSFTAGLAGLIFAIDEAHASSVGWISGRNTLLSALLSLLCLDAHADARQRKRPAARARSVLFAAISRSLVPFVATGLVALCDAPPRRPALCW